MFLCLREFGVLRTFFVFESNLIYLPVLKVLEVLQLLCLHSLQQESKL